MSPVRPEFTSADMSADMVAAWDSIPKTIVSRLTYDGKDQGAHLWYKILKQNLKSRLSEWAFAVCFLSYTPQSAGMDYLTHKDDRRTIWDKECAAADQLKAGFATWLLNLISRETTEGATLVTMLMEDATTAEDGVALLVRVTSRGLIKVDSDIQQQIQKIRSIKFTLGAPVETHEAQYVEIKRLFEKIDHTMRGGDHALQTHMLKCVPQVCEADVALLEKQLDMNVLMGIATYPTPDALLVLLSAIVRKHRAVSTYVTSDWRAQSGQTGGRKCLNCTGNHHAKQCPFKCSICRFPWCGAATPGGVCASSLPVFPSSMKNALGNELPPTLYAKSKEVHARLHKQQTHAPVPTTNVHARSSDVEDAFFERFEQHHISSQRVTFVSMVTPDEQNVFAEFKPTVQENACISTGQPTTLCAKTYMSALVDGMGKDTLQSPIPSDGTNVGENTEVSSDDQHALTNRHSAGTGACMQLPTIFSVTASDNTCTSMALADTCTNSHVLSAQSILLQGRTIPPPVASRNSIHGANQQAPSRVLGEIDLPVRIVVEQRDGKRTTYPIVLTRALVSHDVPGDVIDVQRLFREYGIRFRFEDEMRLTVPGGDSAPLLKTMDGLPSFEVMPVRDNMEKDARCFVASSTQAYGVLLQAARFGCPTREQLKRIVQTCTGAVIASDVVDARAGTMLEYDAIRKQSMMRRQHYDTKDADKLATKCGELIFLDYFGPFPFAAIGTNNAKGLLGSADEHTDTGIVALAKYRTTDDWIEFFDTVRLQYERHGHHVMTALTDRAPELTQSLLGGDGLDMSKWSKHLVSKNVLPHFSLPYQPQPHGRVEIMWQHLQTGARARLLRSGLNDEFFIWAMWNTAQGRQALSPRGHQTSRCKMFTGHEYDASQDKVFGAPGHCWIPPEQRAHKGAAVSAKCVYVGKAPTGWRVIVGHGASAKWVDVTRADFFEIGLITRGLMPYAITLDQQTQTDDVTTSDIDITAAPVRQAGAPIRHTPEQWRSSLRTRPVVATLFTAEAQQLKDEAEVLEWAISTGASPMILTAIAGIKYGAPQMVHELQQTIDERPFTLVTSKTRKKAEPKHVYFDSDHGKYSMVLPQSFSEAMRTPQAPIWFNKCFLDLADSEAKGLLVPMPIDAVPDDEIVLPSTWAFTYKKDNRNYFVDYKVRPSVNGSKENDFNAYSAPATFVEVVSAVAAAVQLRRFVGAADLGKGYTEATRPHAKWKYMHMLQGFTRHDSRGAKMVYGLPNNYWGERAGGRVFEQHKNEKHAEMGFVKAIDTVNIWSKHVGDGMVVTTNVVDDFLIQADARDAIDAHINVHLPAAFRHVKTCMYPTSYDGYSFHWQLGDDGRPNACTVSCPAKIASLIEMLGGIDHVRDRAKGHRVTNELLAAAEVLAAEMTAEGTLTRRATGVAQYISPVRVACKTFVQVLSRVMAGPNASATLLMYLMAAELHDTQFDGLTFTTGDYNALPIAADTRELTDAFTMGAGSPSEPTLAYDTTWGQPRKSVASMVYTCAGAAIDCATLTLPGAQLSSSEAETHAFSWAVARSMYNTNVLRAYGVCIPDRVKAIGDNSVTVNQAAGDASVSQARYYLRRVAFLQDACDDNSGTFVPIKVGTAQNPSDFLGKLVSKVKIEASLNWVTGAHRRPPVDALRNAAISAPGK